MKKNFIFLFGVLSVCTAILFFSCKKINLPTDVGLDVIPEVDNIHTFDTTLEVVAYNGIFDIANDSTRSYKTYPQFLGLIDNDPIFGKTDARMFFELLPGTRIPFPNTPDKLTLDSVVLVMSYIETYGDTAAVQTIRVSELAQSNIFKDSAYLIKNNPFVTSKVLGSKTIIPFKLKDSVNIAHTEDSATLRQMRIRLDDSFGDRLLNYDTSGVNNAYHSDSTFRTFFKGFALQSISGGNAIMGFSLAGSKLAVYYRNENKTTAGKIDTSVTYFRFANYSPSANYIHRDYSGTQVLATANDDIPDNLVYIQSQPGTFATLKIPGLKALPKSIIHLAELSMESVYDSKDTLFSAPDALFMDTYDSSVSKFVTIPYSQQVINLMDNFGISYGYGVSNYAEFGSFPNSGFDLAGNVIKKWRFNLTRYVQNVLINKAKPYNLRLYAPKSMLIYNGETPTENTQVTIEPFSTIVYGVGRVRLGGGNQPGQKMKLRVVYSKT
ncbi:MAG TPA: DUF4270 domain-containing protein [Niabella sp.]|nr:DUF4270 domain-containing protein [Niabella sp.]